MRVIDLKGFTRECGLRGYFKLRKAELISLLRFRDVSTRTSTTNVSTNMSTARTRPPKPTRPPLPLLRALS